MGNRYLVLSDLHLSDHEEHPDGWRAHKSSAFRCDEELARLVDKFLASGDNGDRLTLVLNGDIFDFDLVTVLPEPPPWPISRRERRIGLDPTPEKSVWKLERMLADHEAFLDVLVRVLARGQRVVYVLGNHDREFHFADVRQALVRALEERASKTGRSLSAGSLTFEPWFYYVPNEIYVEHGQQYDYYTSYRYLLWPQFEADGHTCLTVPMGNLSNRYLTNRMGYFNPHASNYILNMFRYLAHWFRYYAFSRRSLMVTWFFGSLNVMFRLLSMKRRLAVRPAEDEQGLERIARRYDLPTTTIRALGTLQQLPIVHRFYRVVREFWIDRLLMSVLMSGGTVALALSPVPLWAKLMVPLSGFPLVYFLYEWLAQGESIFSHEKVIPDNARAIARLLPVRVVTFGHTHVPRLIPLSAKTTYVDTGTWAPILQDGARSALKPGLRNYLICGFHLGDAEVRLGSFLP